MGTELYDRYCEIRDSKGMKDATVSQIAQITKSTFSDWKTGRSIPKREKLLKIAKALEVSPEYLLTGAVSDDDESGWYEEPETASEAQRVFTDPNLRLLFDAAKDAKPEDIRLAAEMLLRFKETNPNG